MSGVDNLVAQNDILDRCIYCNADLDHDKWISIFFYDKHYKEIQCSCGKTHCVNAPFTDGVTDSWIADVKGMFKKAN